MLRTFAEVLDAVGSRPVAPNQQQKRLYAERLSRETATYVANGLRRWFVGITPTADGKQQEAKARSSRGVKRLDINYSTPELGLGLGVSIKTVNFKDAKSQRYTHNLSRIDNELRAEAMDYHQRQPFAVMTGVLLLPADACFDAGPQSASSFGSAVEHLRHRIGREKPTDLPELFEAFYVGLYHHEKPRCGDVEFFDVADAPPYSGRPDLLLTPDQLFDRIRAVYDSRNDPPFVWSDRGPAKK